MRALPTIRAGRPGRDPPEEPRIADPDIRLLVTCEHAGKRVPAAFRELFRGQDALLDTHRGWDPGALTLARELAAAFEAPLFATETTRLLIDNNRSIGTPGLYSEFTRPLPAATRRAIVEAHWRPHREPIVQWVAAAIAAGQRVVHIASHSFTPELDGVVRTADVGLLYDPRRPGEVAWSDRWLDALRRRRPDLRLRRNYPYIGNSDGICYQLRKVHPPQAYAGIELEVNQAFVRAGGRPWKQLREAVLESLRDSLAASPFGVFDVAAPEGRRPLRAAG